MGNGSATGKITSNGAYDLILDTNSGTNSSSIAITDAANGNISFIPNGTGEIVVGSGSSAGKITSSGAHDLVLDTNAGTNSGSITITDAANGAITLATNGNGNVALTTGGTGEVVVGSGSASGKITSSGAYDLVLDTNAGTNSGAITITDAANGAITLATNDRVLVKNQTTTTANGVYKVVASGTASRDPDFDTVAELSGQLVIIQEGSSNADTMWLCTTDNSGSIGAVTITFSQVFPSSGGTVTSVGLTQSGSEFTISGSPVTSSGNITLNVNRISATKIGGGTTVSDTEYGYLANVSSDIQTQLDAKSGAGFAVAMAIAL